MLVRSPTELGVLVQQAQDGSEEAAQELFDRCREPLLAVIREILSPSLRRLYDSDDFLLDAFAEIFRRHFTEEVLRSPQTLWPYLQKIATNKVRDARRKYLLTTRHNINREVGLSQGDLEKIVRSKELSPEETLLLKELVEDRLAVLIEHLPLVLRGMIQLIIEGHNAHQIAHQLQVDSNRVYRALDWLKQKLEE